MPHATGKLGSQKKLAQGFPSEEALSRNLFFVTTGAHNFKLPRFLKIGRCVTASTIICG